MASGACERKNIRACGVAGLCVKTYVYGMWTVCENCVCEWCVNGVCGWYVGVQTSMSTINQICQRKRLEQGEGYPEIGNFFFLVGGSRRKSKEGHVGPVPRRPRRRSWPGAPPGPVGAWLTSLPEVVVEKKYFYYFWIYFLKFLEKNEFLVGNSLFLVGFGLF